jgi:two-component system response regulator GlrR
MTDRNERQGETRVDPPKVAECHSPERDPSQVTTEDAPSRTGTSGAQSRRPGILVLYPRPLAGAPVAWRVGGVTRVGRGERAEIRLIDARVSRTHASLEVGPGGILVRDLGSRNGSFVDGTAVGAEAALAPAGSVVRLGDSLFLVTDDVDALAVPPRTIPGASLGLQRDMLAGASLAAVWDQAKRVANLGDPVLILGETGTGKECIARVIHASSSTKGPFVGLNMAAIPEALFESELFGHARGSFTNARAGRVGAFREADGGVLFLDEVGDVRLDLQAKLLRAIDLKTVRALGEDRDRAVATRVVAATSRDLRADCEAGLFRADLWYRLAGAVIRVPPLRERREDIILLALQMTEAMTPRVWLSADAAERLLLGEWRGNARELSHVVSQAADRAAAAGAAEIRAEDLPEFRPAADHDPTLSARAIETAMHRAGGVTSRAAKLLGVSRSTLYEAKKRLSVGGK